MLRYVFYLFTMSQLLKKNQLNKSSICDIIYEPVSTVSIIVPTYNEESNIENTLISIKNQCVYQEFPEYFEIILADSYSKDNTVEIARPYVDKILMCKKGKLTAIQTAIDNSKGEIIVSIDADTYYPPNWLNNMLKHYYDENVVAVTGNSFFENSDIMHSIPYDLYQTMFISLESRMHGRNISYLKQAYYDSGEFDLNIDQQDVKSMVNEEEYGFHKRLSRLGKVKLDKNIPVLTSDRHIYRNIRDCSKSSDPEHCLQIQNKERF